jgi:hypothetical protein
MAIKLEEETTAGHPVLKLRAIGEEYVGGILKFQMRDAWKDGAPVLKDNGKARQEMVVWLLTHHSTMAASIKGDETVPQRGEIVRRILRGKDFGAWIDAKNTLGRAIQVGDMLRQGCDKAVRFQSMGDHTALGELTDNDQVAEYKQTKAWQDRRESLGFYGPLAIRTPKDEEAAFVVECEQAYHQLATQTIRLDDDRGDPFPASTPNPANNTPATSEDEPW